MHITRGLGLRYIWIDSLCIIQDDQKDLEEQCAVMNLVYLISFCTISASDSKDCRGGCFIPRDPLRIRNCVLTYKSTDSQTTAHVTIHPNFGHWMTALNGPLSSRGWTLQERQLSLRILHYTKLRVLWECRECTPSEDQPEIKQKSETNQFIHDDFNSWRFLDNVQDTHIYEKWYKLVEMYSGRQLSMSSDKLPAISGLAAEVKHRNPDDMYLAGLWKNDLFRGLSWFPDVDHDRYLPRKHSPWPPPQIEPSIPSWSWASFNGPVKHYGENWFNPYGVHEKRDDGRTYLVSKPCSLKLVDARVTVAGLDPCGRVLCGEIILFGRTIEITISEANYRPLVIKKDPFGPKGYSLHEHLKHPTDGMLYFDVDPYHLPETKFVCFQLGTGKGVRGIVEPATDTGIVLIRAACEGKDVYRRVGMFDIIQEDEHWVKTRIEATLSIV